MLNNEKQNSSCISITERMLKFPNGNKSWLNKKIILMIFFPSSQIRAIFDVQASLFTLNGILLSFVEITKGKSTVFIIYL